jgi:hypothetical protein
MVLLTVVNSLALGVMFLAAAAPEAKLETMEATRFVLRDPNGKMRADLGFSEDKSPRLTMYDNNEKALAAIVGTPDGGVLVLNSAKDGKNLVASSSTIHFNDGPNNPRIMFINGPSPFIWVLDDKKNYKVAIGIKNGEPVLLLKNSAGEEVFNKP